MRKDGKVTVYQLEHEDPDGSWHVSDVGHILFRDLRFDDRKRGAPVGERLRDLMRPCQASSQAFQRYGIIPACDRVEDALALLPALAQARPGQRFRVVERVLTQTTSVVQVTVSPVRREKRTQAAG